MTLKELYDYIDERIPFSAQESWDNSGLLVGDTGREIKKVLTALDISKAVIDEAQSLSADVIVSHHPIIFRPLKRIDTSESAAVPVARLIKADIAAICTHTPFDMSPLGMNKGLYELLREPLCLSESYEPLEDLGNGNMIGRIYDIDTILPMRGRDMAKALKGIFDVRASRSFEDKLIRRIAVSSGAGNSFVEAAFEKGCDALVTGDLKLDSYISAENMGIALFDCGHYGTECIFRDIMRDILKGTGLEVISSSAEKDPAACISLS